MSTPGKTILQGWKEIAEFLHRDERTAKRWEKQRRLPVRRMPGSGRANVYVLVPELEAWLRHTPVEELKEAESGEGHLVQQTALASRPRPWFQWGFGAAIVLLGVFAAVLLHHIRASRAAAANKAAVRYVSKVAGVDDMVLRGLYLYEQRTPESLQQALPLFQKATTLDPDDPAAWSGLARTDMLLREYGSMPNIGLFPEAKFAALKAIALDPRLPEPYAVLGFIEFFWFSNQAEAERDFRTALDLDPNSAYAQSLYGVVLTHEGKFAEALDHLDTAQRLQPASTPVIVNRAFALGLSGQRPEAVEILLGVERNGNYPPAAYDLAMLSLAPPKDLAMFLDQERRVGESTHNPNLVALMDIAERAYRSAGEAAMWRAIIAAQSAHDANSTDRIYTVIAQVQLGNFDAALDTLEREKHISRPGPSIAILPWLSPLRNNPRFVRQVAVAQSQTAP